MPTVSSIGRPVILCSTKSSLRVREVIGFLNVRYGYVVMLSWDAIDVDVDGCVIATRLYSLKSEYIQHARLSELSSGIYFSYGGAVEILVQSTESRDT